MALSKREAVEIEKKLSTIEASLANVEERLAVQESRLTQIIVTVIGAIAVGIVLKAS